MYLCLYTIHTLDLHNTSSPSVIPTFICPWQSSITLLTTGQYSNFLFSRRWRSQLASTLFLNHTQILSPFKHRLAQFLHSLQNLSPNSTPLPAYFYLCHLNSTSISLSSLFNPFWADPLTQTWELCSYVFLLNQRVLQLINFILN